MTANMSEPFRLDGKVALVTGGASGIGAATCRQLAAAGAEVWVADINLAAADTLAQGLNGAKALQMDVSDATAVNAAFAQVKRLDILVNNAGIGLVGGVLNTSEEDFARIMNVNVSSVFRVTRAALPLILESH